MKRFFAGMLLAVMLFSFAQPLAATGGGGGFYPLGPNPFGPVYYGPGGIGGGSTGDDYLDNLIGQCDSFEELLTVFVVLFGAGVLYGPMISFLENFYPDCIYTDYDDYYDS
jgi:hypothetical protein